MFCSWSCFHEASKKVPELLNGAVNCYSWSNCSKLAKSCKERKKERNSWIVLLMLLIADLSQAAL
jgi:hypothetical protein